MNAPYRFGRFELNPATRQLLADGGQVTLGARAFDVLVALVERRDRMVSKDELLQIAWPGLVVEENNLDVQISALRKALGPAAITTVRGRGYRFAPKLDSDPPPASERPVDAPERRKEPRPWLVPARRLIWMSGAAVAVVTVLVLATSWYLMRPTAVDTGAKLPDAKSIAVLPFVNISEDKGAAYFADGVQNDLLTQLSLLGDLKVVSRTSVAEYRDTKKNARQIAAELGVASLVEGSVRREGNRVRVSAQLIDAKSDKHLWAAAYDRELKDIFAIQSELATEIARALKVSLTPQQQARLSRKATENIAAYELFLRNQTIEMRGSNFSGAYKLEERISLLSRAVELDPAFALAWARLGAEHARARFFNVDISDARLAKASHAIDRALALAPDDVAVKAEVGYYYYYGLGDYLRAAKYLEELLQIAPNNVEILTQLSWVKRRLGRWLEADSLLKSVLAIDSRNIEGLKTLRENLETFRHWDEAIALQQRILAIVPDNLDESTVLHHLEWRRSGSFARYDGWRKTLPADALERSPMIWIMDFKRSFVHADFDSALRLLDAPPRIHEIPDMLTKELRAMVLLANGDRLRAQQIARASLIEVNAELQQNPSSAWAGLRALLDLAILGQREAALAAHDRWQAMVGMRPDIAVGQAIIFQKTIMYAVLGDGDHALKLIEPFRNRPSMLDWGYLLHFVTVMTLQNDPRFEALAKDFKTPVPLANWGIEKASGAN